VNTIDGNAGATLSDNWWERAACRGRDPEWWADDRAMRPKAVRICLGCQVRVPCLTEALAVGDYGIIRGGMFIGRQRQVVSLVCFHCRRAPVRATANGQARYCGDNCQSAAAQGRAAVATTAGGGTSR
jgi:hypothetical protein